MRTSSLGWATANHAPPPRQVRVDLSSPIPLIEYEDTRADVLLSRLVLWGSVALTVAVVCFNVAYVVSR